MSNGWIHTLHQTGAWLEGAWFNEIEGEGPVPGAHPTMAAAVCAGRELAQARQTEHVIHHLNGTIAVRESYGNDPYAPPS